MKRSALIAALVLTACGADAPAVSEVAPGASAEPPAVDAATLGLTVSEFQDRWNATIGSDSLRITGVDRTAAGFEAQIHPVITVSGTTDGSGMVTTARVTYRGSTADPNVEGAMEERSGALAFMALPRVVGLALSEEEANSALGTLDWPSGTLSGISVDAVIGGVRYTAMDAGGAIVMTAEPA